MFGLIIFILLLPFLLYWASTLLLDQSNGMRLFMENWMKSSSYHVGILIGCIFKCAMPSSEETTNNLKDLTISDSFSSGVKEIWK